MDTEDQDVVVAVSADPDTWMPKVIFAIRIEPEDLEGGYFTMVVSPTEGLHLGSSLVQAASVAANMDEELRDKSVDERREILILESQYIDP